MDPTGLEQGLRPLRALDQGCATRWSMPLDPGRIRIPTAGFTAASATVQATVVRATGIVDQHGPAPPRRRPVKVRAY
ncbi:hypothetical protein [Streptomyces sp. NBC_01361]|uniref:hypothetical protein n=1 Tax=Streptomyces sp. NBC_01361 TaxID=2903838 RepID=UPI002E353558|nr:hypothetical protein [Streptomyces sp. NBC_01361]